MNEKLARLSERRAALVARAASQREALAQSVAPWRTPLAIIDSGLSIARYIKRNPALLLAVAATVAMVVVRPRAVLKWARHGWQAWGVWVGVRRKLSGH